MSEGLEEPICSQCGSSDVVASSGSAWDPGTQSWETIVVYDKGHSCNNCGEDCSLVWKPYDGKT